MNDNAAIFTLTDRRVAELHAIKAMTPSLAEYRALADRYADAVQELQIALAVNDFRLTREAALTLHEISHQTAFLNLGIKNAIARAEQESSHEHYRR